ncbi:MAG: peptide chain release factor-like protein [Candidatus Margulisbacteria bacterium]|nr:peptide chain release factor-like protein [Candidatus Margulisiibacteriota bacterium]
MFFKSSGPGGQRKNKSETAVRIIHLPTGITVVETRHAYQYLNKKDAFKKLEEKLKQRFKKKKSRIPTKINKGTKELILKNKKIHSDKKKMRKKVNLSNY